MKIGKFDRFDWCVVLVVIVICFGLSRGSCVSKDIATRTLEAQGYRDVEVVDTAWFAVGMRGCDKNDAVRFTVRATNPAGQQTEVYVCSGAFLKAGTIRVK